MTAQGLITEWKTSTTPRNTKVNTACASQTILIVANSAICARLLILKMSWALTCYTRWNKTLTFICSTSRQFGALLTIRTRAISGMSASMRTTGRTSDASHIFSSIKAESSASSGTQKKRLKHISMDVSWNTDVKIVMVGKKRNTIRTITKPTNASWRMNVKRNIVPTTTMRMKCADHSQDSGCSLGIEALLWVKPRCTKICIYKSCFVKLPA